MGSKEALSAISEARIRLTRRDFIRLGASLVAVGGAIGAGFKNFTNLENEPQNVSEREVSYPVVPENQMRLAEEIVEFRKTLGLEGIPREMIDLSQNGWEGKAPDYENGLSKKNLSYGEYMKEVITKVLGDNATRLVKGCKENPLIPGGIAFNHNDRTCDLSEDIFNIPLYPDFINFILHEACGHGTDPFLETAEYPKEIIIGVEHGKWRALSQMLNIPDEFLHNPGDVMYPRLKKNLGKIVGFNVVKEDGSLSGIFDERGRILLTKSIESLAQGLGVAPKDIKFNKLVCRQIGATVMAYLLRGDLALAGDLKNTYTSTLEYVVAPEIYAEMVKYAILYPEKVNAEVIDGIGEVIDAINGRDIDLGELRAMILYPSNEVLEQNIAEKKAMEQLVQGIFKEPSGQDGSSMTQEELFTILVQETEAQVRESKFVDFIYSGQIPDTLSVSDEERAKVKELADLFSAYVSKYPGIEQIDLMNDDKFDPDLNLWDIEDLAYALDQPFVRGLVQSSEVSGQMLGEISRKIQILKSLLGTFTYKVL